MCNFHVDGAALAERFGITLAGAFAPELARLFAEDGLAADGMVTMKGDSLTVTPRGRLFVRNVAMVFDTYLAAHEGRPTFSRTV